jgi:hypothetical protein
MEGTPSLLRHTVAEELFPGGRAEFVLSNRSSTRSGELKDRAHSEIDLHKESLMTVGELREKLVGVDPQTKVVVQWEIGRESTYFDVAGVSLREGTPSRFEGIAGFAFGGDGSPAWLFIEVAEA